MKNVWSEALISNRIHCISKQSGYEVCDLIILLRRNVWYIVSQVISGSTKYFDMIHSLITKPDLFTYDFKLLWHIRK